MTKHENVHQFYQWNHIVVLQHGGKGGTTNGGTTAKVWLQVIQDDNIIV